MKNDYLKAYHRRGKANIELKNVNYHFRYFLYLINI